ncbi:hypothetical protein F4818DRAFT_210747 [Hypoxylon cercidicola]|nr:hypothetical protein F4818DRAFT_210747 [Hypoxylon cercidicola]
MEADHIDKLLERYLHLLHEYTSLREQLSSLQTAMYQNIARANFAAERGMRFGRDYYDERMQASRRVAISAGDGQDVPVFTITAGGDESTPSANQEEEEKHEGVFPKKKQQQQQQQQQKKDPLRWFGLLTPQPLRQAQAQSVEAVEQAIPKLASVDAQMAQVEIEIRRARKKRAKAEVAAAAAEKEQQELGSAGTEIAA